MSPDTVRLVDGLPLPTPPGTQRVDWRAVADRLRANPGQWGKVDDVPKSTGTNIRQGKLAALRPSSDWEVAIRRDPALPATRATLYLRYTGFGHDE